MPISLQEDILGKNTVLYVKKQKTRYDASKQRNTKKKDLAKIQCSQRLKS